MRRIIFLILVLLLSLPLTPVAAATSAETLQSLAARLESWEVEEIWPEVLTTLAQYPQDAGILATAADIAYHRGDYQESLRLMKRSLEVGGEDEQRRGFAIFMEETIKVLASYKRYESPHFIITLDESRDGVLADYLIDALEKTLKAMAQRYGFAPREKVRVELFPDSVAFYRGSALSVRDIEVTGAVGLTKFNKLQFLSPRAMVNGYRWLDAISHEYMHYMIFKMSSSKAPIWFHEGLAKYEETSWRNGPSYLSALNQTLLAQALTDNKLIGFDKMEPSLLQLKTPEEVQLAYAQSASAIEFIIGSAGPDGLKRIMTQMVKSRTPGAGESIREVLGLEFPVFEKNWKEFLNGKALKPVAGVNIRRYKVREGERDESGMDLKEIKSLVARNRAHLGDRLKEIGRPRAAVIEYRRALTETHDSVPVMNRLSAVLIELTQHEEALNVLKRTLELDPDHPTPHTQLGQVYTQRKDFQQARMAFEESIQINPFNPLVHLGLADAYTALGDGPGAAKERTIAQKLRR